MVIKKCQILIIDVILHCNTQYYWRIIFVPSMLAYFYMKNVHFISETCRPSRMQRIGTLPESFSDEESDAEVEKIFKNE